MQLSGSSLSIHISPVLTIGCSYTERMPLLLMPYMLPAAKLS